jgi:hypothetical protein
MPRRILATFALAVASGCGATPSSAPLIVMDSEYYPLRVGCTWTYRDDDRQRTVRVVKHEQIDGIACALVETSSDGAVVVTEHIFAKPDGIYGLTSNGDKLPNPLPLLKLPPTPKRTWRVRITKQGKTSEGTYVLSKGEVEVPAGKYQAVMLKAEYLQSGVRQQAFSTWFARGVGIVKQVIYLPDRKLTYELEKVELP